MCLMGWILAVDTTAVKVKYSVRCRAAQIPSSVMIKGTHTAEALAIDTTHKLPTEPSEMFHREE